MSKIGKLQYQVNPGTFDDVRGHIRTLDFTAEIRITLDREASPHPDAPTHVVMARGSGSDFIPVGAGWEKSIIRGENAGDTFLSVTLDDPSFPHPINFAVFKDTDHAVATWRRRQDRG